MRIGNVASCKYLGHRGKMVPSTSPKEEAKMAKRNNRMFGGAGVVIRRPDRKGNDGNFTVVETEHAEEVSTLIFTLKDVFEGSLDYLNKYEFYGRLADAANDQLRYGDDLDALRRIIVGEACEIAAEMGEHLYFAYGSNMDAAQMSRRCPKSICVGTAELRDHRFELDEAGVATVVNRHGSTVHGVLWLISRTDERSLDGYEGVASGCYSKATLPIIDGAGRALPSLVYVSNRDIHDGLTYRSGYMDNIIANARRLGFDPKYIESLEAK